MNPDIRTNDPYQYDQHRCNLCLPMIKTVQVQFFIFRSSSCLQCQPDCCPKEQDNAQNQQPCCSFKIRDIIIISYLILIKLILDRISCIHRNRKYAVPFLFTAVTAEFFPFIRFRYIHITVKIF